MRVSEKGFINAMVMFAIAVLVGLLSVWATANNSSNKTAGSDRAKAIASIVLDQSNNLLIGFSRAIYAGVIPSNITFDNAAGTGIFQLNKGYVSDQVTPVRAMAYGGTPSTFVWRFKNNVKLMNIGDSTKNDSLLILADVDLDVCKEINNSVFNTPSSVVPSTGIGLLSDYQGNTAIDMSTLAEVDGKLEQCISTTDGKYVYYKAAIVN